MIRFCFPLFDTGELSEVAQREMAYNICSSPSSSLYNPFSNSFSSPKNFNSYFKLFLPQSTPSSVSFLVRDDSTLENPPTNSSSKSYIWVNPKSPRASKLRQKSYDARYAFLVKVSESLNSCEANEDVVFSVLSSAFGDKLFEQDAVVVINNLSESDVALLALKFFQQKLEFNREVIIYNVTLKVFRKCRDLEKAEKLFDEMAQKGVKPDNATFSTIISCARLSNMPSKAVEWFQKMQSFGVSPDDVTYSAMIDSYGRSGNVEMALHLYDRARTEKWRLDAVTFSTLIKIYGVAGNFDGCLNVYEEMKALGAKPNLVTYNTLLDAMGRAKRPWQVKKIYRDMIDNGYSPSFVTYAALLRAYGKARYGEDAMSIYREMKEKNLELNVILFNTLLATCADLGYVDEAVEIFEDMKTSGIRPDSWSYSSMVTIFSCSGDVAKAENALNDMLLAGHEPNIYVITSLIQGYGKAQRTDDVVRTFNQLLESGISPDDRFCGCLLNVMTQTTKEEISKLVECIERANSLLGRVVRLILKDQSNEGNLKEEAAELFDAISLDVKKAYCNCLIDLCVNFDMLESASEMLDLGLKLGIYKEIQTRTSSQWSLHLKSLSTGAALTALNVWIKDLSKALESGEEFPPLLGINTGHGKHKYSENGIASVLESHLKELKAPFHEAPDKAGWFLTTKVAAESWLESQKTAETVAV